VVTTPGLFVGTIRHRRFHPRPHDFTYQVFMSLLDIDRIPELMGVSRLTSYNAWNWASFDDRDHFGDPSRPLRERIAQEARRQGIELPGGPILMLTHLRYLGYCFNPVSFFYLFDRAGCLARVLAEVHNTFGGAHLYWLNSDNQSSTFRSTAAKSLYVSPFLPPTLEYRFALTTPADRLAVQIDTLDAGARIVDATLSLERRPWTATEIRRQLLRHPAMTASVTAAIHWQALKLWWKGVPVVRRLTDDGIGERAAWQASNVGAVPAHPKES
jgi:uncharacterized protein